MLDRGEDSHPVVEADEKGKPHVRYSVIYFAKGEEIEMPEDRAKKLINYGYAKAV